VPAAMKDGLAELQMLSSRGLGGWLRRTFGRPTPRPRVSASSTVRLGQPLEVEWRVERAVGTTLVTVSLVGREVAHRRISARTGISVVTERNDFLVVELDRQKPERAVATISGAGATVVPAGLVPSLAARFNEISWAVVVDVVFGPVVTARHEFPLIVLPMTSVLH
jgi:hypothetical protein